MKRSLSLVALLSLAFAVPAAATTRVPPPADKSKEGAQAAPADKGGAVRGAPGGEGGQVRGAPSDKGGQVRGAPADKGGQVRGAPAEKGEVRAAPDKGVRKGDGAAKKAKGDKKVRKAK